MTGGRGAAAVLGWQRIVNQKLWAIMLHAVTDGWHRGWQPAEVIRQVERRSAQGTHAWRRTRVAAEMRGYAATVDERWEAQLTEFGAKQWWDRDDGYLTQWGVRERIDRTR